MSNPDELAGQLSTGRFVLAARIALRSEQLVLTIKSSKNLSGVMVVGEVTPGVRPGRVALGPPDKSECAETLRFRYRTLVPRQAMQTQLEVGII